MCSLCNYYTCVFHFSGLQDYEAALKIDPNNEQLKKDADKMREIIQSSSGQGWQGYGDFIYTCLSKIAADDQRILLNKFTNLDLEDHKHVKDFVVHINMKFRPTTCIKYALYVTCVLEEHINEFSALVWKFGMRIALYEFGNWSIHKFSSFSLWPAVKMHYLCVSQFYISI